MIKKARRRSIYLDMDEIDRTVVAGLEWLRHGPPLPTTIWAATSDVAYEAAYLLAKEMLRKYPELRCVMLLGDGRIYPGRRVGCIRPDFRSDDEALAVLRGRHWTEEQIQILIGRRGDALSGNLNDAPRAN